MIIFHIPGPLRSFNGGRGDLELKAPVSTVSEALQALWVACPGMRDRVVTEQGQVREHINIFVGKENIRYTGGLATPLSVGSEISIVPAISGGSTAEEPDPGRTPQKGLNPFANVAGNKHLSLASFRKNGQAVRTPLWFAEQDGKLYFMTRDDSWKYKRLRNNPRVLVAPCTMRGRITGPDVEGRARILEPWKFAAARRALERKYWRCGCRSGASTMCFWRSRQGDNPVCLAFLSVIKHIYTSARSRAKSGYLTRITRKITSTVRQDHHLSAVCECRWSDHSPGD